MRTGLTWTSIHLKQTISVTRSTLSSLWKWSGFWQSKTSPWAFSLNKFRVWVRSLRTLLLLIIKEGYLNRKKWTKNDFTNSLGSATRSGHKAKMEKKKFWKHWATIRCQAAKRTIQTNKTCKWTLLKTSPKSFKTSQKTKLSLKKWNSSPSKNWKKSWPIVLKVKSRVELTRRV